MIKKVAIKNNRLTIKKLLLILLCLPFIAFGQDKKSSHSIMLGLNTYFAMKDYGLAGREMDRKTIGFDLSYSFSLTSQSNWSYSPYFTYNYIYETISHIGSNFSPSSNDIPIDDSSDNILPLGYHNNIKYTSQSSNFFIGQKFGYIHNRIFSTYIGTSILINTNYLDAYLELEERLILTKTHFTFFNIRTSIVERSYLKNSNFGSWFNVISTTIGYGIAF